MAEKYPGWTPYHYVHNNPINLIDPTGMEADGWRKDLKTGEMSYCVSFTEENTDSSLYEYSDASQDSNFTYNSDGSKTSMSTGGAKTKDYLEDANTALDFSSVYLKNRNNFQGGSFRLFKSLKEGDVWSPKYYSNNFGAAGNLKHTTYNVSKTIGKSSQVGSILLQGPDIVNGIIADQGLGRNTTVETAGAVGSILGGAWLGGKTSAAVSLHTKNPWAIGILTIVGAAAGGALGEKGAEELIKAFPENRNNRRDPVLHKR
ncbi:MAG TPA: hypothetical protein VKZ80_06450 [Flavobacterium sp.]|nr:hypothetical protein [Flavobacterium sp.]